MLSVQVLTRRSVTSTCRFGPKPLFGDFHSSFYHNVALVEVVTCTEQQLVMFGAVSLSLYIKCFCLHPSEPGGIGP